MARKIFMNAFNEYSQPAYDVLNVNGISFNYDKPFFLICNYPIQDKAYFEVTIDSYYPIKAFKEIPIYLGIHKEASFGALNSDFIIGAIYSKNTEDYDIMSKYSRQYLNTHTHPTSIHTRVPGAKDVIGVGADYANNQVNIFVNGRLFYSIENKTYDEDGNVDTQFDIDSGTFYFCLWSNVYYKKVLTDFNTDSNDKEVEDSKRITGHVNFGANGCEYLPEGYVTMYSLYADHKTPPDPEDEQEDPTDSFIFDPTLYEGMNQEIVYVGDNPDIPIRNSNCSVEIKNDVFTPDVNTMSLICNSTDESKVTITDKYRYTMDATIDEQEEYFKSGASIFINKPIPTEKKIYIEFYVTEGQLKSDKIGIPVSIGISGSVNSIINKSSRVNLWHKQWYHFFWDEMSNDSPRYADWIQSIHEIDNVFTTTSPEQGQVIGVGFNLAKNKMTVFVNNTKFYTMYTNIAEDRTTGEKFTIYRNAGDLLLLVGDNGTTYEETSKNYFVCSNGLEYNADNHVSLGRYDLYEVGGTLLFEHKSLNVYEYNGEIYDLTIEDDYYLVFTSRSNTGDVYRQVKSDVIQRQSDGTYFEMYHNELTGDYTFIKVHSTKEIIISELNYSLPWDFTYAFIHDDGAFDGTIKGSFNFGQSTFAATIPEGYISLWEYYSLSNRSVYVTDIPSSITITNNKVISNSFPSQIKIVNTGLNGAFSNDGLNRMILNHATISNTEAYCFDLKGVDLNDFTSMIAKENNGYIPEEKLNSTTVSFEGVVHYNIIIEQSPNQTIEVTLNGKQRYTTPFQAPKGSAITVRVIPDKGYVAGSPSVVTATVIEDILITATEATLESYRVTLTPTQNQYIEVENVISVDDEGEITESVIYDSRTTMYFTVNKNNPILFVRVIADPGWIAGKANYSKTNVSKPITISATDARREVYNVTIPITSHYKLKVRVGQFTYESKQLEKDKDPAPVIIHVSYEDTAYISIASIDVGYKLEGEYIDHIQVFKDLQLPTPTIVDDICVITVDDSRFNGEYSISNSTRIGNNYYIRRGDEVTITATPSDGLYIDDFILE